jgi:hypothetical protein
MNKLKIGLTGAFLWLDAFATAFLVFILIGMWVFRDRLFTIGNPLAMLDLVILVGIIFILLFNIVSLFWFGRAHIKSGKSRASDLVLFGIGVLCTVMMMAEKVMADEIAHETASGWKIQAEYLMLYGMLLIQLVYNLLIGMRLLPKQPESTIKHMVPGI